MVNLSLNKVTQPRLANVTMETTLHFKKIWYPPQSSCLEYSNFLFYHRSIASRSQILIRQLFSIKHCQGHVEGHYHSILVPMARFKLVCVEIIGGRIRISELHMPGLEHEWFVGTDIELAMSRLLITDHHLMDFLELILWNDGFRIIPNHHDVQLKNDFMYCNLPNFIDLIKNLLSITKEFFNWHHSSTIIVLS